MITERKTYSVPQAATILGIGKAKAYEWARSGELPGVLKIDSRFLVSRRVLDGYVNGEQHHEAS
ncbi:helix-turn-helix domain-containing protein [Glutamicibacter sp. JL.03c]|uniref:helix-turn-helix domain-containing protein n=1 Tax=Glutamicibacter sp. JL.03c TaxID=2984842 RepID=UPI0021F7860B|nr:helix-turn-helix domain-containing protein [Glutamicibacter sp. JL.03c]UYQ78085.1 helix-turn-helix domain-containing protein [Glutamicibacter sp. JL.03c]